MPTWFRRLRPLPLHGRLLEADVLAAARRAAHAAYPDSAVFDLMSQLSLEMKGDVLTWSVSSLTIGSQAIVTIDDATGAVISVERRGLR